MNRKIAIALISLTMLSTLILAGTFRDQRDKFREEINLKVEEPIAGSKLYSSVTFKNEKAWDFKITPDQAGKIKAQLQSYFNLNDQKMLEQMAAEMNQGRFIVFKEFSSEADGVNLKCAFLSPKVPYWDALTDINDIERLFYVYNFSVAFGKKSQTETYVVLQTQGKFMGFTKAVTLPLIFNADYPNRVLSWKMPTQKELLEVADKIPGKGTVQDRFIALARAHQWFQDKDDQGNYGVSDQELQKILDQAILNKDKKCDVYQCAGKWKIDETISDDYYLVTYSLLSVVNIQAFIPPNIPLVGAMFKKIAQSVSDEVSAKYLPLSMKNFRDHTVKWAKESK